MRAFTKFFYRKAEHIYGVPIACKRYGLKHPTKSKIFLLVDSAKNIQFPAVLELSDDFI